MSLFGGPPRLDSGGFVPLSHRSGQRPPTKADPPCVGDVGCRLSRPPAGNGRDRCAPPGATRSRLRRLCERIGLPASRGRRSSRLARGGRSDARCRARKPSGARSSWARDTKLIPAEMDHVVNSSGALNIQSNKYLNVNTASGTEALPLSYGPRRVLEL